jgi:signal transduction histidine kinase
MGSHQPVAALRPRRGLRALKPAVALLAAAGLAVGAIGTALMYSGVDPPWIVVMFLGGWICLAAGVVAWPRRPSNRLAALICAGRLAWIDSDEGDRPELADALADALGDPSLELLFWDERALGYVDGVGRAVALPEERRDRHAVEIALAGHRVGAIVYDATLIADEEMRSAGRVVALALDRQRLMTELRTSRERLRTSRARIVEAADAERRRIAHDLHDGLQTRLVLLAVQANDVRQDVMVSAGVRAQAAELQSGLDSAMVELRGLVQGVLPAVLTERGLYAAAEDLADRSPIPIRVDFDGAALASLPAVVETTGYFVLSEAVANALKHSHARALEVRIARNNGQLEIEILDDGVGGAGGSNGTGLRGMADRIEALDGRLLVESRHGGGTRVLAQMPCAR